MALVEIYDIKGKLIETIDDIKGELLWNAVNYAGSVNTIKTTAGKQNYIKNKSSVN